MNDHSLQSTTDERYGSFALIRRLLPNRAWRIGANTPLPSRLWQWPPAEAVSAWFIGDVINQAYVNRNLSGIVTLGIITVALFAIKGSQPTATL